MSKTGVAVVGCGLVGSRRAATAATDPRCELRLVVDTNAGAAESLAQKYGARSAPDWREAIADASIGIVVAATPNAYLRDIAVAALGAGKHVLVEKPMGKDSADAAAVAAAALASGKILKVGFNHRYHGALMKARDLFTGGAIGTLVNMRARYGHGARPGYEREWRADPALAGGGELTDQGAHLIDLMLWLAGKPREAFAYAQTAVWPIAPLEDNGFALLRFAGGTVASLHASWTQWKNLFSFEIFGTGGSLQVEGLGGSYGPEKLATVKRSLDGGAPEVEEIAFDGEDRSWELEWRDFTGAALDGKPYWGSAVDGLAVMEVLAALYESARTGMPVTIPQG